MTESDIAIVGGGLAGSAILREIVLQNDAAHPINITIYDQNGAFGGGLPYSQTMPLPFLLLDQTQYLGRSDFIDWVRDHSAEICQQLQTQTPVRVQDWGTQLAKSLQQGQIATTHLPRQIFGDYLRTQFADTCQQAAKNNIEIAVKTDTVTNLTLSADNHWHVQTATNQSLHAKQIVLATGGIPRRNPSDWLMQPSYIASPYAQSLEALQLRLCRVLAAQPKGQRRIVIKGAHASAIEIVLAVYLSARLFALCDEIVVIAPSGQFPTVDVDDEMLPFVPEQVSSLSFRPNLTAHTLWHAYTADHSTAHQNGYTIRAAEDIIGKQFARVFAQLSHAEKQRFVEQFGKPQKTLVRRMSPFYVKLAQRLQAMGKLKFISAELNDVTYKEGRWQLCWRNGGQTTGAVFANCSGFGALSKTNNPLWRRLVSAETKLKINDMDRGVVVDSTLLAAHNLYALGPMLGGTTVHPHYFWELMSIRRITRLAADIARQLLPRELPERVYS